MFIDEKGVSLMFRKTAVGKTVLVLLYCGRQGVEKVSFISLLVWDKSVTLNTSVRKMSFTLHKRIC